MIERLHEKTLALVKEERLITGLVIENLQKISDTKLFLQMGYSSLFEYCTRSLGYSESSAYRRISALKISRDLPEIKEKLNSGVLNLTTLSMAQSFFASAEKEMAKNKESKNVHKSEASFQHKNNSHLKLNVETKRQILTQIENCSKREAEVILAASAEKIGFKPEAAPKEKLRIISGDEAVLQLRLSHQTIKKIEQIKSLRAHKNPNMSYSDVIDDMCDLVLKRIDPIKSSQIKKNRVNCNSNAVTAAISPTHIAKLSDPKNQGELKRQCDDRKNPRYLPANLKREVWQRDGGQCTYIGKKTGQRCNSKHLLQFDHVRPLFLGGETSRQNLRLLCHAHHRLRDDEFWPANDI